MAAQGPALRLFWQAHQAFVDAGITPQAAVMTANFFKRMLDEIHGGGEELVRKLVMSNSDDPVTYSGIEIRLAFLEDVRPVLMSGRVADHLASFELEER